MFGRLCKLVNKGFNLLLVGEFGIGKTYLLNELAKHYETIVLEP
jgi:DNA replication protein DnaC